MLDPVSWGRFHYPAGLTPAALADLPYGAFGHLVRSRDPFWRLREDHPAPAAGYLETLRDCLIEDGEFQLDDLSDSDLWDRIDHIDAHLVAVFCGLQANSPQYELRERLDDAAARFLAAHDVRSFTEFFDAARERQDAAGAVAASTGPLL